MHVGAWWPSNLVKNFRQVRRLYISLGQCWLRWITITLPVNALLIGCEFTTYKARSFLANDVGNRRPPTRCLWSTWSCEWLPIGTPTSQQLWWGQPGESLPPQGDLHTGVWWTSWRDNGWELVPIWQSSCHMPAFMSAISANLNSRIRLTSWAGRLAIGSNDGAWFNDDTHRS